MSSRDFYLGMIQRDRGLYFFTELGPFKSHREAVAYYDTQPRSGDRRNVVTIEHVPVRARRGGAPYGTRYVVRHLDGSEAKGTW